jgi:hypothetical protein
MARIRTIKPEFWTDAKTGMLPEFTKCLFLGLLNHADDYGVLEFDPVEWRAKIFPYHSDTTTGAVNAALTDDLLTRGLVILFTVTNDEGDEHKQYLFIKNFHRHQVINKPSKPLLKDWKLGDTPATYAKRVGFEHRPIGPADLASDQPTLPTGSGSPTGGLPPGKERKGKEGKGEDKRETAPDGADSGSESAPDGAGTFSSITREPVPEEARVLGNYDFLSDDGSVLILADEFRELEAALPSIKNVRGVVRHSCRSWLLAIARTERKETLLRWLRKKNAENAQRQPVGKREDDKDRVRRAVEADVERRKQADRALAVQERIHREHRERMEARNEIRSRGEPSPPQESGRC